MNVEIYKKITESKERYTSICIALVIWFAIVALEILPSMLQIALAFGFAAVIGVLTRVTTRASHGLCRAHTLQQLAVIKFLKWRLIIAGMGIVIWVGGMAFGWLVGYRALQARGADVDLEDVFATAGIMLVATGIGAFLSIFAILMSRRVRAWFLGLSFLSGMVVTLLPLLVGGLLALILTVILIALFKGFILILGIGVWLYTLYLLTRPCSEPEKYTYKLILTGDKGHTEITPEQTPYTLTPGQYATLSSDIPSLSSAPFIIGCDAEGERWTLTPGSGRKYTVLHNGSPTSTDERLTTGSRISLQQVSTTPSSKGKSTDRQVLSIALFGDAGHADIYPMNTPLGVSSYEYKKASTDGELIQDSPYELTTDADKSGSVWFITPRHESEWEVLVNGELLTGKAALEVGSTISLRKKGSSEEVARVEVKSRIVYEITPGQPTPADATTRIQGQLRVTITTEKA